MVGDFNDGLSYDWGVDGRGKEILGREGSKYIWCLGGVV